MDFESEAQELMSLNLENPTGHYALRLASWLKIQCAAQTFSAAADRVGTSPSVFVI